MGDDFGGELGERAGRGRVVFHVLWRGRRVSAGGTKTVSQAPLGLGWQREKSTHVEHFRAPQSKHQASYESVAGEQESKRSKFATASSLCSSKRPRAPGGPAPAARTQSPSAALYQYQRHSSSLHSFTPSTLSSNPSRSEPPREEERRRLSHLSTPRRTCRGLGAPNTLSGNKGGPALEES